MAATGSNRAQSSALRQDVQEGLLSKLDKTARINRLIFEVRLDPAARERLTSDTEAVMAAYGPSQAGRGAPPRSIRPFPAPAPAPAAYSAKGCHTLRLGSL